ncbi:DUF4259 domain-containing protein [Micromonospora sp. NPDC051296]|uniref:DUF4259 domain-containing protein n=1 Tax=Micromonospora sp. NPDC051296 TaxID=3155046 RepID=UPI003446CC28
MGFWDVSPFGNDDAADFAIELDEATTAARVELVGRALERVVDTADDPGLWPIPRAVAAAALVAAQCPDGEVIPLSGGHPHRCRDSQPTSGNWPSMLWTV